jgi:SAM-dependent methyltransferase
MSRRGRGDRSELQRWRDGPYPRYLEEVNRSIGFAGLTVDFFTHGKAVHLARLTSNRFSEASASSWLDIGCGQGSMHRYLRGSAGQLQGVDVSAEALHAAAAANPWASYTHYDGNDLPFADCCFDVVFTSCVLHHVAPPRRPHFLSEAYRVLRPGGLMVVFEHNPLNPLTRLAVLRCEFDRDAVLLMRRETVRLVSDAGFEAVGGKYIFFLPLASPWARAIDDKLGFLALGAQYLVSGARPGGA